MLLLVPYLSSISLSILGTSTAGDTAATTEPIKAASNRLMSKSLGAIKIIPIISKLAGTKHINIAGRPTFFKSSISRLSPAIWLSSLPRLSRAMRAPSQPC